MLCSPVPPIISQSHKNGDRNIVAFADIHLSVGNDTRICCIISHNIGVTVPRKRKCMGHLSPICQMSSTDFQLYWLVIKSFEDKKEKSSVL